MEGLSYLFKGLQIMATVSEWSQRALADGKVTLTEAVDLVERVCPILGVPLEIDVSGGNAGAPDQVETDLDEKPSELKKSWEQ